MIRLFTLVGNVCAVVGPVGSGKSTLLKLLLGEIQISSGTFTVGGTTSFSSQKPWLFSSTIRKNIIFGQDFNENRYKRVLEVCGLTQEVEQFQDGDQTIVGNRGVSLSGGQRARINLARAVYKEADIYLLDDVLSALDPKIGKYVFQECILKFLSGKTRVLVTHQLHYLKEVGHIVILKKGSIENQGQFTELFEKKLEPYLLEANIEENNDRKKSFNEKNGQLVMQKSTSEEKNSSMTDIDDVNNLKGSVILKYINLSGGSSNIILLFILLLISQLSLNLSDYWITLWSEEEYIRHLYKPTSNSNSSYSNKAVGMKTKKIFFLPVNNSIFSHWTETVFVDLKQYTMIKPSVMRTIYIMIILLAIFLMLCRSSLFFYLCTRASQKLHNKMFSSILETSMAFFYTTPPGNTLNRLSKDMGAADEQFPKTLLNFLGSLPVIFGSMLLIVISNSLMIILVIPLVLILIKIRKWFLKTVRILRRYETAGVTTIRSNKCEELLIPQFDRHQDLHSATSFMAISCTSSFGLWIDLLCVSFVCFVVLFFIILDRYIYISGSFIGLAIFHSMTMVGLFQSCIRTMSETVNYLTNIDRIFDYTQLKKEEALQPNDGIVPRLWPCRGDIEFKNLSLKYIGDDRSILQNINITIYDSEKIGIVGRTGAGKSSLIAALFRLSPLEGDIFIDEVNIQDIELKKLRKEIAIIPQDPVLFSASVRFNLDPEYLYPDERIWKILAEVELDKIIPSLDFQLTGGGDNMSLGQRQLLCLARAILRENKILILDEATANIDIKTDELIQKTIKRKFHNATVLTVAHRLNSVMTSDRVLVLDGGKVVEFDHPSVLLQKKNGYFRRLAEEAGPDVADSNEKFSSKDLMKRRS
ncbi:ATP-binding cassette sub-family C member 4-like isoform X2 [Harmonia axyridis]|uniref:ATP-binding cassette sub-family C member 4-like isoform X2 n=1 Tax=Harmonia axyridis TaxID=115357 RepID=UPI001E278660|nr:ATP-binding cassette sub-family C member 4-like isoform X2 [Harmonia axyridis]